MPASVPEVLAAWMQPFAVYFTTAVWRHVLVLVAGALLAPGRRTVIGGAAHHGPGPSAGLRRRACRKVFGVHGSLGIRAGCASDPELAHDPERHRRELKRRSKDDFKGRHFEAALIVQAVSWYLRYPLSYRDIEELFLNVASRWTTPP